MENESKKFEAQPSITGLPKRQLSSNSSGNGVAAVDWLEWTCFGTYADVEFIKEVLGEGKKTREADEDRGGLVRLSDEIFVRVRPGRLKRGLWFEFAFDSSGIVFGFRFTDDEKQPVAFVRATGMALLQHGLGVIEYAKKVFAVLGVNVTSTTISRLDLAADLFDVGVQYFADAFHSERLVTRARLYNEYRDCRKLTGVVFGNGLQMRVYDKLLESAKDETARALLEMRWGGPQKLVTRVEFQLRRDKLVELGLSSLEDLDLKLGEVLQWLTEDWFRVVNEKVKFGHYSRVSVCRIWEGIRSVFGQLATFKGLVAPKHIARPEPAKLIRQAIGCVASAFVLRTGRVPTLETMGAELAFWCRTYAGSMVPRAEARLKKFLTEGTLIFQGVGQ